MKAIMILGLTLLAWTITAKGQDPKGELFWVVESNTNNTDQSLVKIYGQHNELLHEFKLDKKLDVTNRRHRRVLTQIVRRYSTRDIAVGKRTRSKFSI